MVWSTSLIAPHSCYNVWAQMQNRLKTTKRNQETHQKQLDELRAVLENEKADRPESVGLPLPLLPASSCTVIIINSTFQDERQDALSKLTDARTNLHDFEILCSQQRNGPIGMNTGLRRCEKPLSKWQARWRNLVLDLLRNDLPKIRWSFKDVVGGVHRNPRWRMDCNLTT